MSVIAVVSWVFV